MLVLGTAMHVVIVIVQSKLILRNRRVRRNGVVSAAMRSRYTAEVTTHHALDLSIARRCACREIGYNLVADTHT